MSEERFFVVITERVNRSPRILSTQIVLGTNGFQAVWELSREHANWEEEKVLDVVDCGLVSDE